MAINTSIPPFYPNQELPARNLWPAIEGRELLAAIATKTAQLSEISPDCWQINIEQQWQLYSSDTDVFATEHAVRPHFFQAVQIQQPLSHYFSQPRCLAIVETGQAEQWRLWQLLKSQTSLANLLEQSLAHDSSQKFAARLFVIADKFISTCQQFAELDIDLPLNLNNLGLLNHKIIFIGFIPSYLKAKSSLSINARLEQSFKTTADALIHHPNLDAAQILDYLKIYASESREKKIVVELFVKLLSQNQSL